MRNSDWQTQLAESIARWESVEFSWGSADCVCFGSDCVIAVRGDDPMKEFRGKYDSPETAKEAISKAGYRTLYHVLQKKFGKPVPVTYAQRGDVIYRKGSLETGAVGICAGREGLFISDKGWVRLKLHEIDGKAFRVR